MMNFVLPNDGGDGPTFTTRRHNPREATTDSMKDVRTQFTETYGGLIRDNPLFALSLGIRLSWIKNLDEIRNYRPQDGGPPPIIQWTEEAKNQVADLFNGNHHYKLLLEELADTLKQLEEIEKRMEKYEGLDKPSKAQKNQEVVDEGLKEKVLEILTEKGRFSALLIDLGMWCNLCELQHVVTHIYYRCFGGFTFTCFDEASTLSQP